MHTDRQADIHTQTHRVNINTTISYRCQVDLADLKLDVTHNLVLDLDVGVGQIHLQLCITGTSSQQSSTANGYALGTQQSQEETNWEQIVKKYVSITISSHHAVMCSIVT